MYGRKQQEDWDQDDYLADNNYAETDEYTYRVLDFDHSPERSYTPSMESELEAHLDELEAQDAEDKQEDKDEGKEVSLEGDPAIEALISELLSNAQSN
jgi:hypothetical protein